MTCAHLRHYEILIWIVARSGTNPAPRVERFGSVVGRVPSPSAKKLGASGLRILHALAQGETDAKKLAELGDERLRCTEEQLVDALTGRVQPMHRGMLGLQLQRLQLIDQQMAELGRMIAQVMKSHQDAVIRL